MLRQIGTTLAAGAVAFVLAGSAAAETVIIGHFGNPTPMQVAAAEKKFSEATGWDVEWRKFASGAEVIAAMASGDIKLSELGSSPLAIAASQGVELQLFLIAQAIGKAESLIVRNGSGIETLSDLKGKRIAVPVGSTAHFSLMGVLAHEGLTNNDVTVMSMPPDQIAAAWQQDAIDGAFIWQPVQSQILQTGKLLVGADTAAEWGYPDLRRVGGQPRIRQGAQGWHGGLHPRDERSQHGLSEGSGRVDGRQRASQDHRGLYRRGPGAGSRNPVGLHLSAACRSRSGPSGSAGAWPMR